jgi:hypothetical protein
MYDTGSFCGRNIYIRQALQHPRLSRPAVLAPVARLFRRPSRHRFFFPRTTKPRPASTAPEKCDRFRRGRASKRVSAMIEKNNTTELIRLFRRFECMGVRALSYVSRRALNREFSQRNPLFRANKITILTLFRI